MKMGPTILDIEDLVWHENMQQPELAVELGPAGSKDELAWNCGGTSSQSRDGAKQKGGEQVATWLKREPGFQDSPISKSASFPNDPDIRSFVLFLCKDSIWDEAQSQRKDLPATMA